MNQRVIGWSQENSHGLLSIVVSIAIGVGHVACHDPYHIAITHVTPGNETCA